MTKTAVITGARKGIGLELAKMFVEMGWRVFGTTRDNDITGKTVDGITYLIDVEHSFDYCATSEVDVLINNAANSSDWVPGVSHTPFLDMEEHDFEWQMIDNVVIPIANIQNLYREKRFGTGARIVNVVSGVGEFSHPDAFKDFQAGYATSKCALIMATKKIAAALQPHGIYCNAACPGWCKTDMGGPDAPRTAREGAESILKACFLDVENPPTGLYFRDGHRIKIEG